VYALGVVLYELLTGQWPYAEGAAGAGGPRTVSEVMRAVLDTEPARPSAAALAGEGAQRQGGADLRRLAAALRGDLDTILLKALCKLPGRRYASAERFADDLRRFLARQPIAARPPVWTYRARLFLRRHRHASLAAGAAAGLAMAFGATTWQQYRQSVGHQERAVVMRDFMVGLINDAEPDQNQPDQPVTALQMLDGAARRARKDYGDRPRLQGELLAELGRMYLQLGEVRLAQPLLVDALALLERAAPAPDPALNQTRAQLASLLVEYGEVARQADAAALAAAAIHHCRGQPAECARVRAEAWDVLAGIEQSKGRFEAVLQLMRQAVEEARVGYGAGHSRTLQALNDTAVSARNAGLFMEADRLVDELLAAAEGQTLPASLRINILHLKARIECDLGRYASARRRVEALIAQAPGRSGPALEDRGRSRPNDQLVGALRLLSAVLLEQGDPLGAYRAADSAVALFRPEQRPTEVLYVRQARVQAQGLLEPSGPVLDEAQAVLDGLAALGQAPDAVPMLRARRVRGELLARQGRLAQARQVLEATLSQATPDQPATPRAVLQAVTLDQLGSVLRELGLAEEARQRHEAARVLLLQALPQEHPYLARNALYMEAARAAATNGANRTALLAQAEIYKRLFSEDSIWRRVVDRSLGPACRGAAGRSGPRPSDCLLLL
jgi:serine/threonine-protein kinase